jgi:hypothetical protein
MVILGGHLSVGRLSRIPASLPSQRRAIGSLHRKFVLETLAVASDGGNSKRLPIAPKGELAILLFDAPVQMEPILLLRVTDVVEGKHN